MPKPRWSIPTKPAPLAYLEPGKLPPNDSPPAFFLAMWLDATQWEWDPYRGVHRMVTRNHVVEIVRRKGVTSTDWTWRAKRLTGFGIVWHVGGIGFESAREARRDVLATFWSDFWNCRPWHEHWRHLGAGKPVKRREVIDQRAKLAAEIETERLKA